MMRNCYQRLHLTGLQSGGICEPLPFEYLPKVYFTSATNATVAGCSDTFKDAYNKKYSNRAVILQFCS